MYATSEEQKQIIHDCFNGNQERDCENCAAHHSRANGKCCFGDEEEYDPDDEDCQRCPFEDDCSLSVAETIAKREHREIEKQAIYQGHQNRRIYPNNKPTYQSNRPRVATVARTQPAERLVQIGGIRRRPTVITPSNQLVQDDRMPGETLFQRFLKDSVWGAGQGFFEMAADFFRTHRLP